MRAHIYRTILFIFLILPGCTSIELNSPWRTTDITIDGNNNDWQRNTFTIEDVKNVIVGVTNNDTNLYLSLTIGDRSLQRQIAMAGLTVWLDRTGGEEKKFGIHYPIGRGMPGMLMRRPRSDEDPPRQDFDSLPMPHMEFSDELEISGPMEGEHRRMRLVETGGIEAAIRLLNDVLVYEMKVPLTDTGPTPYAIGTNAGSTIGVGVEAGSGDGPGGLSGTMMREPPGGGLGRRGGGASMGGGPPAGAGRMREPLKFWAKLHLAVSGGNTTP